MTYRYLLISVLNNMNFPLLHVTSQMTLKTSNIHKIILSVSKLKTTRPASMQNGENLLFFIVAISISFVKLEIFWFKRFLVLQLHHRGSLVTIKIIDCDFLSCLDIIRPQKSENNVFKKCLYYHYFFMVTLI